MLSDGPCAACLGTVEDVATLLCMHEVRRWIEQPMLKERHQTETEKTTDHPSRMHPLSDNIKTVTKTDLSASDHCEYEGVVGVGEPEVATTGVGVWSSA